MEEILIVIVCLLLNALLAAFEMAFVAVRRNELRRLAKDGRKDAARLLALRETPERTLSVIQIGITLVGAVSASVAGAGAVEDLEPLLAERLGIGPLLAEALAILVVVLPMTYLLVVIGELVPKTVALRNPSRVVLGGARWLFLAERLLAPAVTALEWSTRLVVRAFFPQVPPSAPPEASVEIDSLEGHHRQAVLNLTHIEGKPLRQILLPWKDVNAVRSTDSMDDVVQVVFASGHTRLPVLGEDGHVSGVLHTKEFLAYRESGGKDWPSIVRTILRVRSTDTALSALRLMQARRSHMAAVHSPAGELLGIVTLEDISEEIWGDIFDEDEDSRIRKIFAERVKRRRPPLHG